MDPSFDTWTSAFLLASGQGFFLSLILLLKRHHSVKERILALILFLFSLNLIEYVAFWTGYRIIFPHLNLMSIPIIFVYGPLIYLYMQYSLEKGYQFKREYLIHFIPAIMTLAYLFPYYILDGEIKIGYMTQELSVELGVWRVYFNAVLPWLQITFLGFYSFLSYRGLQKRKQEISQEGYKRFSIIVYSFLGFTTSYLLYYIMLYTTGYVLIYDYIISVTMSVFIYGIGYLGFSQNLTGSVYRNADKYLSSGLNEEQLKEYSEIILQTTEKKQLYLNRELNLDILAKEVALNKHDLSRILNEQIGKSFSEFINEYRISKAKRLLEEGSSHLNMLGIAFESGFNNKASFNTSFKRYTGMTPSQYKKEAQL